MNAYPDTQSVQLSNAAAMPWLQIPLPLYMPPRPHRLLGLDYARTHEPSFYLYHTRPRIDRVASTKSQAGGRPNAGMAMAQH